ncbi:MAG: hypothetical protein JW850_03935 [Thermoflexales bacterium]|nr:hypothetical protein [Thermoflexales bacterium]
MTKTFKTYRNGWKGDPSSLPGVLQAVIGDFAGRHAVMPKSVMIHPTAAGAAAAALAGLGLASLEVQTAGGCLLGEIWLEVPEAEAVRLCDGCRQPVTRQDERRGQCVHCGALLLTMAVGQAIE